MRILLIGNGFDLYHGLPTRYMSFLEFANVLNNICFAEEFLKKGPAYKLTDDLLSKYNLQKISDENLRKYITYLQTENEDMKKKLSSCLDGNLWIKYFNKQKKALGQSWVDFEAEISRVVQAMDKCLKDVSFVRNIEGTDYWPTISLFDQRKKIMLAPVIPMYKEDVIAMRDVALNDLDRLIAALEIYLNDFVEKIPVECYIPELKVEKFDKLLSFNYTSTYERLYGDINPNIDCDYVHGKANANDDIVDMVLGIDDYQTEQEANSDTTFIRFKKYYQKLLKRTGFKNNDWLNQISSEHIKTELYIFGHSLNYSDKEILRNYMLNENVTTTIFYYSDGQYGRILENLVRVIGRENIGLAMGYDSAKIRFVKQQPRVSIDLKDNSND